MKTIKHGKEVFCVEQSDRGLFQSVFPSRYAELSSLHRTEREAWEYIRQEYKRIRMEGKNDTKNISQT